eukprot:gene5120-6229_t
MSFKATVEPPLWILLNPLAWVLWALDFLLFAKRPALGTRKYLGDYKPEGAKFPLKKFGETEWLSYDDCGKIAFQFGSGLRTLGMQPLPQGVDFEKYCGPSTLLIFEDTCAQWTLAAHGAFSQSIVVATSYSTLGLDSVACAVHETSAPVVLCNYKNVEKVAALANQCPKLTTIVYTDFHVEPGHPLIRLDSRLKILSFDEVVALGTANSCTVVTPSPDCMALLMYTSGSTGKPKGVMIKHSSLVAAVGSVYHHVKDHIVEGQECYFGYLPAAHIMEFTGQLCFFSFGASIGYSDPRTISSKGAVRVRPDGTIHDQPGYPYPPGGIQEFRPSTMMAVPKIWDILKKGVEDGVDAGGPVKRFLFQVAFSGRAKALAAGRDSPLFKALVFGKLKAMMGGRMRITLSGGGAISSEVQTFIRTAFCMPLIQGYGLTETNSAGTAQDIFDVRDGNTGHPVPATELRLAPCWEVLDKEQKPYLPEDTAHYKVPCAGRGEVCIRGAPLAAGYYKQPDKTAEAWDGDGWFHTGDIGVWNPDGTLSLVDRLKNLVKLKGGEYIALEAMEREYSNSEYVNGVNGGLMVHGTSEMDRPGALVQVNMSKLKMWGNKAGYRFRTDEELCGSEYAVKEVMRTMNECHKNGSLGGNEKLASVVLISGNGSPEHLTHISPWGPGTGLTASNKLDRKFITAALPDEIALLEKAGA